MELPPELFDHLCGRLHLIQNSQEHSASPDGVNVDKTTAA